MEIRRRRTMNSLALLSMYAPSRPGQGLNGTSRDMLKILNSGSGSLNDREFGNSGSLRLIRIILGTKDACFTSANMPAIPIG